MEKSKGYIYVLLAATGWSLLGFFNRLLADCGVDVGTTIVIRNTGSLIAMTVVFLLFRRQVFHIQIKHLPLFLGSGVIGVLGFGLAYFACQRLCSLAVAATLSYLAPAFVVIAAAVLWKTLITNRRAVAIVLALAGCALVSGIVGEQTSASLAGILLGVGSAVCYASYTVFAHYGLQRYDSYTMIYWTFCMAGVASLTFLDVSAIPLLAQPKAILAGLGLVMIATVLPYLLYTKALEQLESGRAAVMANAEPVLAAISGIVLFHEVPTVWTAAGIMLVLVAVVLIATDRTPQSTKTA